MLGLWWDSVTLTRTLDERKLVVYMEMIADFIARPKLTLHEMQVAAGRLQRCLLTFPPGAACLLVSLFTLMVGLRLPWHVRRVSKKVRYDFAFIHRLLHQNLGRGYYSYSNFSDGPEVRSDACKKRSYTGGGYVSSCGRYNFWKYGSRATRQCIDYLEGDVVVVAVEQLGHLWNKCRVSFGVDNMAFQKSAEKGRSKVDRLNVLVRELFSLMLRFHCIISFYWLSSEDNILADDLSRDREAEFLSRVHESGFLAADANLIRHENAGRTRTLPENRGAVKLEIESKSSQKKQCNSSQKKPAVAKAGGSSRVSKIAVSMLCMFAICSPSDAMPLTSQEVSVPYTRSSIFGAALPCHLVSYIEDMLDNRLSDSSWRTIDSGLNRWKELARSEGWSTIIPTDDPDRGPKLATFVCHLLQDTNLVWASIDSYVWGVRTWMMLQHQADPLMGVMGWSPFAKAAKILSWVPAEPRKRVPADLVKRMLADTDMTSFEDVQMSFLMLTLLYTFSRSECPCPKAFSGRQSYNQEEHWNVEDFIVGLCRAGGSLMCMWVRFRKIKQDQRVEREEAKGEGDWAFIGDIPGSEFSILFWYRKLMGLMGHRPDRRQSFFLDKDMKRPLLYHKALKQFYERQRRVGVAEEDLAGLHGLRVEGYNGTENALGDEVAAAHGLWRSKCSKRYARFSMDLIAKIPSYIMGLVSSTPKPNDESDETELSNATRNMQIERAAHRPKARMSRRVVPIEPAPAPGFLPSVYMSTGRVDSDDSSSSSDDDGEAVRTESVNLLPPGWKELPRVTPAGRQYNTFEGPAGEKATSRPHAWRIHDGLCTNSSRVRTPAHVPGLSDADDDSPDYVPFTKRNVDIQLVNC